MKAREKARIENGLLKKPDCNVGYEPVSRNEITLKYEIDPKTKT